LKEPDFWCAQRTRVCGPLRTPKIENSSSFLEVLILPDIPVPGIIKEKDAHAGVLLKCG
jgi:hypothetical protein